jgi:hypothetical protein
MKDKEVWQSKLIDYITKTQPEKLKFNPSIIEITDNHIIFGMEKHMGRLILSKSELETKDSIC